MPLREIEDKFTKSELVLLAWRSQEQHYHFKQKMKKYDDEGESKGKGSKRKKYEDGIGPESLPDEYFAQEDIYDGAGKLVASKGDLNLSQVKGEQARQYFERALRIPMPPGSSRISNTDPEMQAAYGRKPGQR